MAVPVNMSSPFFAARWVDRSQKTQALWALIFARVSELGCRA